MPLNTAARHFAPLATALVLMTGLAACNTLDVGSVTRDRIEGNDLTPDGMAQVRVGQSQALVTSVLGSPQFTNDFNTESAYYYVSSHVTETSFGWDTVRDRTVLAVYFDKNKKVKDRAVYTLKDGKAFAVETRRTPSYGEDRTFIQSILSSVTSMGGTPHL